MKKINWNAGITIAVIGAGAALLAAFISPFVSDWLTRKKVSPPRLVDKAQIEKLEIISQESEYKISSSLNAHQASTLAFYAEANKEFLDHYVSSPPGKNDGSSPDLGYLMGPAGAGKSTLTQSLRGPNSCYVKLSDEFTKGKSAHYSVPKEDLKVGDTVNKLPGLADQKQFSLIEILTNARCCRAGACKSLAILDDLDELHPDLSKYLLQVIETDVQSQPRSSLPKQILVVGRPEGFFYYFTERTRTPDPKISYFTLKLPKYLSQGDLKVLYSGAIDRRKDRDLDTPASPAESQSVFINLIPSEGWLSYTISQLAYADFVTEYVLMKKKEGGRKLRDQLFDNILFYNSQSHHRPQTGNPVYVNLLEDIAVHYVDDAVKNNGYFDVPFEASIPVFSGHQNKTQIGTLSIQEVLNRSGVAYLDAATLRTPRYRFQPRWLHAYLVQRWNERMSKPR